MPVKSSKFQNEQSVSLLGSDEEEATVSFFENFHAIVASEQYNFECCRIPLKTRLNIPFSNSCLQTMKMQLWLSF